MSRALAIAVLVLIGMGSPVIAQERTQEERIQALEKKLEALQKEKQRLEDQVRQLRQERQPQPPRRGVPQPLPDPFRRWFQGHPFRGFEFGPRFMHDWLESQRNHGLGQHLQGDSISIRQSKDGIRLEVKKRGADGKDASEVYEADSAEAFKKKYPEVVKKYGLSFEDGGVSMQAPKLDFGRRLPRMERAPGFDLLPQTSTRGRLGVYVGEVDAKAAAELDLEKGEGLVVDRVERGSLAARLGIKKGDVLVTINGKTIRGPETIRRVLKATKKRGTVTVQLARDGKALTLKAPKTVIKKSKDLRQI